MKNILGHILKEIRKSRGFSQTKLSKYLDTNIPTISQTELGKRVPRKETLEKWLALDKRKKEQPVNIYSVPLLPAFPADDPTHIFQDQEIEQINIPDKFYKRGLIENIRAFPVKGDCMTPAIPNGAIVIAEWNHGQIEWRSKKIYLFFFLDEERHEIRRYIPGRKDNEALLIAENRGYDPIAKLKSDIKIEARVLGYFMPEIK